MRWDGSDKLSRNVGKKLLNPAWLRGFKVFDGIAEVGGKINFILNGQKNTRFVSMPCEWHRRYRVCSMRFISLTERSRGTTNTGHGNRIWRRVTKVFMCLKPHSGTAFDQSLWTRRPFPGHPPRSFEASDNGVVVLIQPQSTQVCCIVLCQISTLISGPSELLFLYKMQQIYHGFSPGNKHTTIL